MQALGFVWRAPHLVAVSSEDVESMLVTHTPDHASQGYRNYKSCMTVYFIHASMFIDGWFCVDAYAQFWMHADEARLAARA